MDLPTTISIVGSLLALLYAGLLWEIRLLRKERHAHANQIQYALLCISVIATATGVELPPPPKS